MNRIILIGNGFDLAHGLPTSYADFIRGYNITLKLGLLEGEYERYDGLCSVNISDPEDRKTLEQFRWMLQDNTFRFIRNLGEITPAERLQELCLIARDSPQQTWDKSDIHSPTKVRYGGTDISEPIVPVCSIAQNFHTHK